MFIYIVPINKLVPIILLCSGDHPYRIPVLFELREIYKEKILKFYIRVKLDNGNQFL